VQDTTLPPYAASRKSDINHTLNGIVMCLNLNIHSVMSHKNKIWNFMAQEMVEITCLLGK